MKLIKFTLQAGGDVWVNPDAISHVSRYNFLSSGEYKADNCTGITTTSGLTIPVTDSIEEIASEVKFWTSGS